MRGQPLTLFEREKIEFFLRGKVGIRGIARSLHRDHSVIQRELGRNTDRDGVYRSAIAHARAAQRKRKGRKRWKLDQDTVLRSWVIQQLREGWSPPQIAGQIKRRPHSEMRGKRLCHETIYHYIYEGEGRHLGLYQYLVRKHKRRVRRYARTSRNAPGIPFVTPIRYRINGKEAESDTMIFPGQHEVLSVQYIPQFQLARFHKAPNKGAEATLDALTMSMESLSYRELWASITFDRGTEGALHWKLRMRYGIDTFHCDPYCSWQKGGVENLNGLIRRYFPRSTDMSLVSDADIHAIQERLNDRPRKQLDWRTPNEAFTEYRTSHDLHPLEGGALRS